MDCKEIIGNTLSVKYYNEKQIKVKKKRDDRSRLRKSLTLREHLKVRLFYLTYITENVFGIYKIWDYRFISSPSPPV